MLTRNQKKEFRKAILEAQEKLFGMMDKPSSMADHPDLKALFKKIKWSPQDFFTELTRVVRLLEKEFSAPESEALDPTKPAVIQNISHNLEAGAAA